MDTLVHDIRFAIRVLLARPLLTVLAMLCLGLGIGATTAVLAPIDVFLFRPLPYPHADRLISAYVTNKHRGWTHTPFSMLDLLDYRAASKTIDIAGYHGGSFNAVTGDGHAERLFGVSVTSNFFRVMGTPPVIGRALLPHEETAGHHSVIISQRLWRRRFAGDSAVIGRTMRLDGTPYTIVGVAPKGFAYPSRFIDLWTGFAIDSTQRRDTQSREWYFIRGIGRLAPGASLAEAQQELSGVARGLAAKYPETDAGNGIRLSTLHDAIFTDQYRSASVIAGLAVSLLLLIAITNVTNLLLARAAAREHEIAIRTAIGAGRRRIVRQLLTESTILALAGGALGVALAFPMLRGLVALLPSDAPGIQRIAIDPQVIGFACAITIFAGILAGLAPAFKASARDVRGALQDDGRGRVLARGGARLRNVLVATQVCLALVLLVASGLLVKGFEHIERADLGFATQHVLTAQADLPDRTYTTTDQRIHFVHALLARIDAIPGVTSAAATNILPFGGEAFTYYRTDGGTKITGQSPATSTRLISPEYFRTLGMTLRAGRDFSDADGPDAPKVVVVSQRFAQQQWPGDSALGRRIAFVSGTFEVVGVVNDAKLNGAEAPAPATVYLPYDQIAQPQLGIVVRATGDPAALAPAIRAATFAVDPDEPLYAVQTLAALTAATTQTNAMLSRGMLAVAGIAFLLAVIGVYGVTTYSVGQRTREIGIRMAMGAENADVTRQIVRQGAAIVGIGTATGLLLAVLVTRGLSAFLFGVSAFDPIVFGGITVLLVATAIVASYLPARRAARVDPLIALRAE